MKTPRHIGIIGCSAEGAALCYRTICMEAPPLLGSHAHPEVTLHTPSLALYVDALTRGDLPAVSRLMSRSADILAAAGADILICPDNTIHQALPGEFRRPFIHIAQAVAADAARQGLSRLAVLGTRWLMESAVYRQALHREGIEAVVPGEGDRAAIDAIIMDELVPGRIEAASRRRVDAIIEELAGGGCDGAILGCTELPLLLDGQGSSV
ncbi:MAG: amino acid racemase, partial [Pseudomonadota bacterium]